jgi:hypothetical protein
MLPALSTRANHGVQCCVRKISQITSPPRHHPVEVQLHFAVHHAADALDQALGLIVFLADPHHVFQLYARRDGKVDW